MSSVEARRFTKVFRDVFADGGRIDSGELSQLQRAAGQIRDTRERVEAQKIVGLVRHDFELDDFEVKPARRALASLLGVTAERLPPELEQVLEHAVPQANVLVEHYNLDFDFSEDGDTFPATARIRLEEPAGDNAILEIDPERIAVAEVLVDGRAVPFDVEQGRLHVRAPGARELEVRYQVSPTTDTSGYGLIRDRYAGRMWTMLWPDHTGALFPSNSMPADGATATVTVKVSDGTEAVGPGADAAGAFQIGKPVPAYAIAFYTGSFGDRAEAESDQGVLVEAHELAPGVPKRLREAYTKAAADAVDYFAEWLGPYEYGDRLDLIEVPGGYGGMEHAGAIAMMTGTASNPKAARKLAVHETSHHWFGDNVRIKSWGDFWMSEGFARYVEHRFFRHHQGESTFYQLLDDSKAKVRRALGSCSTGLAAPSHTDPREIFSAIPYEMGAWMLRMIEARVGTDTFDGLLRDWYQSKRLESVSTGDFVSFIRDRTGKDYGAFFAEWNDITEVPSLKDRSQVRGASITVELEERAPLPAGTQVPLVLHGRGGERKQVWVDPKDRPTIDAGFEIAEHEWDPTHTVLADIR